MTAWDQPIFIALGVGVCLLVAAFLFRVGNPKRKKPDFECILCGRKQAGIYAREWRYCPYCGHPKPPPPRPY